MSFERPCSLARYNYTSYFYPTFTESTAHSHLLVSPVLLAAAVVGLVIVLSCVTIIVGGISKDRQEQLQRQDQRLRHRRRRHRRRHNYHHHRDYEHSYASDGQTYTSSSRSLPDACSPAGDWPPPVELSSDGDLDGEVLRELYPDSPPGYEECVGPGATQLYVPTDAPPPYSLTDSCPELTCVLDPGRGHSAPRTISTDTLPSYEAVCGAGPPSGLLLLLPLPGPGLGPHSPRDSPIPTRAPASGPERIV